MATYIRYHVLIFVMLALLGGVVGTNFTIKNYALSTPGGQRFEKEIGRAYLRRELIKIANFIWNMLDQKNLTDRKVVDVVHIVVCKYYGAEATTSGNIVNISSVYVEGYQGNVKWEITSLLYHEMTHVWQWNGEGQAPRGLVEGIADYTILKANYYPPAYAKPGSGDKWDQGYDFTARFLEYCEGLKPGFVAALNKMMRNFFDIKFFNVLLGKSVDRLWQEYKAKYAGRN